MAKWMVLVYVMNCFWICNLEATAYHPTGEKDELQELFDRLFGARLKNDVIETNRNQHTLDLQTGNDERMDKSLEKKNMQSNLLSNKEENVNLENDQLIREINTNLLLQRFKQMKKWIEADGSVRGTFPTTTKSTTASTITTTTTTTETTTTTTTTAEATTPSAKKCRICFWGTCFKYTC